MGKSILLRSEDYWAIWIGGLILLFGLSIFFLNPPAGLDQLSQLEAQLDTESNVAPFKTVEWHEILNAQQKISAGKTNWGKRLKWFTSKPGTWDTNPIHSFVTTQQSAEGTRKEGEKLSLDYKKQAETLKSDAILAQNLAKESSFKDEALNQLAITKIETWQEAESKLGKALSKSKTKAGNKFGGMLLLFIVLWLLLGAGLQAMEESSLTKLFPGFLTVFTIGIIAYFIAGQSDLKAMGLGYALWAIVLGLLISNTIGIPGWLKPALATPFYIKTALVLLGAEILMGKILAIGVPGLFVAWVVTPIVLISTYWFGQKVLKIPSKSLNMTISADMSVCGVSAAVATGAACNATKEELTLAIGLSMIFTSIMMVVLPGFINWVGMPEVLGGAWIGGTIDATGAVVAAGAFLGEKALSVAATIKMIQNILIGVIAFGVAVYFTTKVENEGNTQKIGLGEIWKRFPKFILGFIGASILFSICYELLGPAKGHALIDQGTIGVFSKNLRGWLFCLAFVSIGLSTNFKGLRQQFSGGKPLILYLTGQLFNLCLTLLMAYLMFYLVFPEITANI